ncbi:tRNA1(Val) (adenine(37)-N6)-methyltransferase [Chondromyces apiculatus]|nr:methyltransferase domain-containing protein [Chondromyces apiculatus]
MDVARDVAPDAAAGVLSTGGIVRPARRPAGWKAPGPRPVTPADRPEVWPGAGEDLCYLAGDFRILQRVDGHRWSADDLVTAWFAAEQCGGDPPRRTVDLGCGIGTVLLCTAWRFPEARCTGVEAQEVSAGLARRSVAWNGLEGRVDVRHGDMREPVSLEGLGPADLVTGTPPYLPPGTGIESSRVQCAPCRFEHRGGVEVYFEAAAQFLAPRGVFVGCSAARQRDRVVRSAEASGLALEVWMDAIPREGKAPLFSVYAARRPAQGARGAHGAGDAHGAGETRGFEEATPLVIRGADGRFTDTFNALRRAMGIPVF